MELNKLRYLTSYTLLRQYQCLTTLRYDFRMLDEAKNINRVITFCIFVLFYLQLRRTPPPYW